MSQGGEGGIANKITPAAKKITGKPVRLQNCNVWFKLDDASFIDFNVGFYSIKPEQLYRIPSYTPLSSIVWSKAHLKYDNKDELE